MKKKLINALRTKFSDKGLNQTELEELADIIGQNLTEESTDDDINNAVSGVAGYVGIMQKFGNRCASAVETKYKGYVPPKPDDDDNEPPKPDGGLTNEQVQQMITEAVSKAVAPLKEAEEAKRLHGILSSNEKLKGIPSSFVQRYKLDKEENADTMASAIEQITCLHCSNAMVGVFNSISSNVESSLSVLDISSSPMIFPVKLPNFSLNGSRIILVKKLNRK